jgi:asparagine synthase (glutamine-hydrolysing)
MCGFAGIVNFASPNPPAIDVALLKRMGQPVAHRGSDGQGTFISPDDRVGLIHYRLAIVDLPAGSQPMCNENGTVWVVFNGEIYNHVELRPALEAAGHRFKTDHCDTETIVHAYEEYGEKCPEHLRGMFAFAVVDLKKQSVFLARDRLGQKPLYCGLDDDGTLRFSSGPLECRCSTAALGCVSPFPAGGVGRGDIRITAEGGCATSFAVERIGQYLRCGYLDWSDSKLPPAVAARFEAGKLAVQRYWRLPPCRPRGMKYRIASLPQTVKLVRDQLVEATELRLRADVEVGCFLSGGTDSAIIASIIRRELGKPLRTFTIGTPDPAYDEREPARRVAAELGTDHTEFEVQPDHLLDCLDDLIETVAEPFADSSIVPTFWVSKLTRQHVKVALSGDGGDEAFGGYSRYRAVRLANRLRWTRPFWQLTWPIWRMFRGAGHRSRGTRIRRFADGMRQGVAEANRYWTWSLFQDDAITRLLRGEARSAGTSMWPREDFRRDPVDAAIRNDYQTYLPGDILTKVDRASMRVALEVRSPFLDHKLIELALSLPSKWKLHGRIGKWILREAFKDLVPPSVWTQPKRGFSLPLDRWFRGELLGLLRESVGFLPGDAFDHAFIDKFLDDHVAGRVEHSQRLWALLWLGRWWKRFVV